MNVITLEMTIKDVIVAMCEGSPGALRALCEMLEADPAMGYVAICHLDDLEIRGSDIWLGYKDICDYNATLLTAMAIDHETGLKNKIQEIHAKERKLCSP